jgi:hypothetical protein
MPALSGFESALPWLGEREPDLGCLHIQPRQPLRESGASVFDSAPPGVDQRAKIARALPKGDSGIDGTMRRSVAAVEARRSRPPWRVAGQVAVTEGWGKGGPNP